MKSRDVIAALKRDGWFEVAQRGSHKQFKHPAKPGRVTVPHPVKDIPKGTLRSIERQARIRLRENRQDDSLVKSLILAQKMENKERK